MFSTSVLTTIYMLCALISFVFMVWIQKKDNGHLKEGELVLLLVLGLVWPMTAVLWLLVEGIVGLTNWINKL